MAKNRETNWNKKIALKIEMYARGIFGFDDSNKDIKFYYSTAEVQPYVNLQHMLNKMFEGNLNDESLEFLTVYSEFDHKSLRAIGEEASYEMLEAFEKILSKYRKDLLL